MRVICCNFAGFCQGVCRAIDRATALRRTFETVLTDGNLVHNRRVLADLAANRIVPLENDSSLPQPDACLLIRAHGVSPERREFLRRQPLPLFDATCPEVGKIAGLIKRQAANGAAIFIFGDPDHAETRGLIGYARGRIAAGEDLAAMEGFSQHLLSSGNFFSSDFPIALFAQTTADHDAFLDFSVQFLRQFPRAEIFDTVCQATKERQRELQDLRRRPDIDAIVVVGDRTSSNSRKLFQLAAEGEKRTMFIESVQQIDPADFHHCKTVLLAAGASTSQTDITAVRTFLESLYV